MITEKILSFHFPFWEYLEEHQKSQLLSTATVSKYQAKTQIHSGSVDCSGIFIVSSGQLRTYILSPEGREITLFQSKAGDVCVLSASCVLEAITFDVHIDTTLDTELIQIPRNVFQDLTNSNIYVENFVYKVAITRFSEVMWVMEQILFMTMDKRLAIFLLDEGPDIKMTHEEIAKSLGSAREVVSRMLKYFANEGYVSLSRGHVLVIDRKSLMNLGSL